MNEKEITELARQIRLETLKSLTQLGFGHYGGSMSWLKPWPCCTVR